MCVCVGGGGGGGGDVQVNEIMDCMYQQRTVRLASFPGLLHLQFLIACSMQNGHPFLHTVSNQQLGV